MEYRTLGNTGLKLSTLGFGGAPLGGSYGDLNEQEGIKAVHTAVDLGVNFIDVAPYYGVTRAETVLGMALKTIPRDKYYLCTKVGRYDRTVFDFSAERVTASVDESLQRLNVDYVDLMIVHDVEFGSIDQVVNETIPALRRVQETGKVRFVGISGLPIKIFREVAERTELDFILSYCRYCLNDTSLAGLIPYLKSKGIGVINASALSMGMLTESGPPEWHPASNEIKEHCAAAARHCRSKGVDISQLALQFSVAQPNVASTLVGISNPGEIIENLRWINEPLDEDLLTEVQDILAPIQNQTWPSGNPENND